MSNYSVLLIEDDPDVRLACMQALQLEGIEILGVASVEDARVHLAHFRHQGIIVTDMRLPGIGGFEFQKELNRRVPEIPVIIITGHGDIETAVTAMHNGAYDFLPKPFNAQQFTNVVKRALDKRRLEQEIRQLRRQLANTRLPEHALLGNSLVMTEIRNTLTDIATTPANVMIYGASGTGKALAAHCLHEMSGRTGPFVTVDCSALPAGLFDSELFGNEAGFSTESPAARIGKLEFARGGTLFLDKVEYLPAAIQSKLSRALQERAFERPGAHQRIAIDLRVIGSGKPELAAMKNDTNLRPELHFLLNIASISLPQLCERPEDIPLLFSHFVAKAAELFDREPREIRESELTRLMVREWPGNIRELRNEAERFVLGINRQQEQDEDLQNLSLTDIVESFECRLIVSELNNQKGNLTQAAKKLHIAKSTLFDKLKKYNIKY